VRRQAVDTINIEQIVIKCRFEIIFISAENLNIGDK